MESHAADVDLLVARSWSDDWKGRMVYDVINLCITTEDRLIYTEEVPMNRKYPTSNAEPQWTTPDEGQRTLADYERGDS